MILVRNVFRLKFGKAREAAALWKEGIEFIKKSGAGSARVCTDMVAPFYTLVLETTHENLADFESFHKSHAGSPEWKKWFEKFVPLVESGHREIFNVVE